MSDPASITLIRDEISEGPWRCFHCDEVFESRECAAHHFGHNEDQTPICKIKGAGEYALIDALRKAQLARDEAWKAISAEDTDSARVFYAMQGDHQQALIREEQRGYDKGLADGRAEAALAQPARAQAGVAELVAKWRAEADAIGRERQENASAPGLLWHGEKQGRERALRECADALAALNGGEDGNDR